MQQSGVRRAPARGQARSVRRRAGSGGAATSPTTGSKANLGEDRGRSGDAVHARRLRRRAVVVLRRLGRGDRRQPAAGSPPTARALLAHPTVARASTKPGPIAPSSRSARPTATKRRPRPSAASDRPRSLRRAGLRGCGRRRCGRGGSAGPASNSAGAAHGGRHPRPSPSTDSARRSALVKRDGARRVAPGRKRAGDRVERIGEIAPRRRRVGAVGGEGAGRALPAGDRRLRRGDLVRAHAVEEIVLRIVLADMVEAQQAPGARPVEIGRLQRRLNSPGSPQPGTAQRARAPSTRPCILGLT